VVLDLTKLTMSNARREEGESIIDTSRMSEGERAALEITEAAREAASMERTFAGGLFLGTCDWSQITPFPEQTTEDRDQGDAFLSRLEEFLRNNTDPDKIDESGEIPDAVIDGLARLGAFGIKIPVRYGGLGLSQTNYCRAAVLLGSWCGNMTALLSSPINRCSNRSFSLAPSHNAKNIFRGLLRRNLRFCADRAGRWVHPPAWNSRGTERRTDRLS
jgi:hypothetical protein